MATGTDPTWLKYVTSRHREYSDVLQVLVPESELFEVEKALLGAGYTLQYPAVKMASLTAVRKVVSDKIID